ncbi:DUF3800 domain-containing protein [Clostridium baratii]|uniref:DUF3800 domain-containing protein n=1 Tax=Clostridium baratii TaxID=1561 RepID=UPI0030CFC8B2
MGYTLFIDESGNINLNNKEKYFTIGGYLINKGDKSHRYKMKKLIQRVNENREEFFNYYALNEGLTEVKYSNLSYEGKKFVLEQLNDFNGIFVAIVVDKENCYSLTKWDTNEYYNYLVCQLIKYIFEVCNHSKGIDFDVLDLIYDNRSMKVKARNNLQAHLINQLKLKRPKKKQFSCNFNVTSADSKVNHGVMIGDFIAGFCRHSFMRKNDELNNMIKIKYLSKFPYKYFEKEINAKSIEKNNKKLLTNIL